ncbi:MAG: hypothetical protein HRT73_02565, partial [Flavobacteriales bacterium]|nr:hypothetical protein [Flavobacteriales bacterium]
MGKINNLNTSKDEVSKLESFTLTAHIIGNDDEVIFYIPSSESTTFSNGKKEITKESLSSEIRTVSVVTALNGEPNLFKIFAKTKKTRGT